MLSGSYVIKVDNSKLLSTLTLLKSGSCLLFEEVHTLVRKSNSMNEVDRRCTIYLDETNVD